VAFVIQPLPAKVIQQHPGHKSFAITMDRYGHLYPEAGEQIVDALERAFNTA
jgi:integrase